MDVGPYFQLISAIIAIQCNPNRINIALIPARGGKVIPHRALGEMKNPLAISFQGYCCFYVG